MDLLFHKHFEGAEMKSVQSSYHQFHGMKKGSASNLVNIFVQQQMHMDHTKNTVSSSTSVIMCIFVSAGTCFLRHCPFLMFGKNKRMLMRYLAVCVSVYKPSPNNTAR
jgi:hypothetical protein